MKVMSQSEAGQRLARGIALAAREVPLVLAITPGGAAVSAEVAASLGAELDVLTVVRLEVPGRMHSTFGAVADGAVFLQPDRVRELDLPGDYVDSLASLARTDVERITSARRGHESAIPLAGRTIALVDDGSADATLMMGAVTALRRSGVKRIIVASPEVALELGDFLARAADEQVVLDRIGAGTQVRDPSFSHTTEHDILDLVRRNRQSGASARPL